jgi:hypothetical protein
LPPFAGRVFSHYPSAKTIYPVWGNWPVHYNKGVMEVIGQDKSVRVLPLPAYAPRLSPIGKLWQFLKQKIMHAHRLAGHRDRRKQKIAAFPTTPNKYPQETRKYTGPVTCLVNDS